jgi:hypothetical protein
MSTNVQRIASSTSRCAAGRLNKVDTWNEKNTLVDVVEEDDAYFSHLILRVIDEEEVYFSNSYQLTTSKISRKNRSGKGRVKNCKSDCRQNGARVSQYIQKNELSGCNKKNENCSKKLRKKISKKPLKQLKLRRRKIAREEIQLEHLQARKENVQARVRDSIKQYYHDQRDASSSYEHYESYLGEDDDILPAQDLGLDDGSMYERLLNIFEGGEIMPEDYEILLQLDSNNAKPTLPNESLQEIPILVVGNGDGHTISRSDMKKKYFFSHCEICLESLMELDDGRELRVLPCEHIFCRGCIDHWFQEVSNRCPNLSCYWCQVDNSE